MKNITGIILGGGRSSRMGKDKCLTKMGDKCLIEYMIDVLKKFGVNEIIINTNKPEQFHSFPHSICCDVIANKGPLGGIYSSLRMSKTEENIVVPCDTPFVSEELLEILVENNNKNKISFPKYKDRVYPLIGCYKKHVSAYLKSMINDGDLKAGNLVLYPDVSVVDIEKLGMKDVERTLANINDRETLKYYEKRM